MISVSVSQTNMLFYWSIQAEVTCWNWDLLDSGSFLSLFKEYFRKNFHKVPQVEPIVKGVQQFGRIFRIWKYEITSFI